jgi:hypothetical protein
VGRTFGVTVRAANADGSASESWSVRVVQAPEDLIALFRFEEGGEGWALRGWRSGPYDPGISEWAADGGHATGNIVARGSGATNNLDTCNREGGILERTISTAGRRRIRVEYDCRADLAPPPQDSGLGSCAVLEGTGEDKLVVSVSSAGLEGPWRTVQVLSGSGQLPSAWTRQAVDISDLPSVEDNPHFSLRLQWQLNTAAESGRIDQVRVSGVTLGARFRRGDSNADANLDISDPIATLGFLFGGGPMGCLDAADANDSGEIDISDAIHSFSFEFLGGPPPPPPFPACSVDPTDDALGCDEPPPCA